MNKSGQKSISMLVSKPWATVVEYLPEFTKVLDGSHMAIEDMKLVVRGGDDGGLIGVLSFWYADDGEYKVVFTTGSDLLGVLGGLERKLGDNTSWKKDKYRNETKGYG